MRKRSLFLEGLLLIIITFGMASCAIGGDDKENEIVEDPLKTQSEYYIVGTVRSSTGMVSNATVTISDDIKATTNSSGVYSLAVSEAKTYKLTFTADGYEAFETTASIASGAAKRSLTTINVKLAKTLVFGPLYAANGATIEVPRLESLTQEIVGIIGFPMDGADENTKIAAVAFEEARVSSPATSTQPQQIQASNNNIAIKSSPTDAKAFKDIKISILNPSEQANQGHFDINNMTVESKDLPVTRAASPKVGFENNHYIITIPKGEKIAGKYFLKVKFTKQADNIIADGYNSVNDKNEVIKVTNNDYTAQTNISLKVKIKSGWEYLTSPAQALKDAGASDALAKEIGKYIEDEEGGKSDYYEIEKNLTASLSGNHVLYYGSKSMSRMKTYTFKVMVNGQNKNIVVKLKSYEGHKEEYTNGPTSQHSGGGTGSQN